MRDLRGVIDRENAEIGVLITLQIPTQPMKTEAASAGFYKSSWGSTHARLQAITIAELLAGKHVDMPIVTGMNATFKQAPQARPGSRVIQPSLTEAHQDYDIDEIEG